eukprot:CAMPEP_0171520726 /NCGR_PEP_ID=MMETSP0959-20130129/6701_1 /TAXON_ID=87120 /ORGANISM="Aurantiochytrium limacinum, Strain ATCCMYA-1381" /LENGTH=64 /DNA_ID=CAMNT_0012060477 /DNA_START=14 /DNA_END=208 /DNA_ORIENTATION=-
MAKPPFTNYHGKLAQAGRENLTRAISLKAKWSLRACCLVIRLVGSQPGIGSAVVFPSNEHFMEV